jgi:hypothetical protein
MADEEQTAPAAADIATPAPDPAPTRPPARRSRPKRKTRPAPARARAADAEAEAPQPPHVWLAWNKERGIRYGHVPTEGSGEHGELTPDEVQQYFQTRAFYDQATQIDQAYSVVAAADLRVPQAFWESTRPKDGE